MRLSMTNRESGWLGSAEFLVVADDGYYCNAPVELVSITNEGSVHYWDNMLILYGVRDGEIFLLPANDALQR